jgi:hypothetical protein
MKLWIARDHTGLYMYSSEPILYKNIKECVWLGEDYCRLPSHWFPGLTFEDGPLEVELKPKDKLSFEEIEELIDDLI